VYGLPGAEQFKFRAELRSCRIPQQVVFLHTLHQHASHRRSASPVYQLVQAFQQPLGVWMLDEVPETGRLPLRYFLGVASIPSKNSNTSWRVQHRHAFIVFSSTMM